MIKQLWLALRELFSDETEYEAWRAVYRWFYE